VKIPAPSFSAAYCSVVEAVRIVVPSLISAVDGVAGFVPTIPE
jgi:hypothetical protein